LIPSLQVSRYPGRIVLAVIAIALVLALAACSAPKPTPLDGVEVLEYQGEKLSSVNDFRDNSIRGPQQVEKDTYRLEVFGLVDKPLSLTYDEVLAQKRYSKVVTLHCVEGWDATILWDGVLIDDLLKLAAAKPEANTVIFHAADEYTSSLSLDFIRQNQILLAGKMNEVTLPPERGFPFQVVAEAKWGYKWVKWVKKIELTNDPLYRGYWESAGYNNNGDLSGPKLEKIPLPQ
jgi:DMSO/TMAO reductase YedYZ molybdopterin-dependent catalytic subunit